jgi:hypothetical protein
MPVAVIRSVSSLANLPAKKVSPVNSLLSSIPCWSAPDRSIKLCSGLTLLYFGAGQIQERFFSAASSRLRSPLSVLADPAILAKGIMDLSLEFSSVQTVVLSFVLAQDRYKSVLSSGVPLTAIARVGSRRRVADPAIGQNYWASVTRIFISSDRRFELRSGAGQIQERFVERCPPVCQPSCHCRFSPIQ